MQPSASNIENSFKKVIEINGVDWYIGMPDESKSVFGSSMFFDDCKFPSLKDLSDARVELCQHLKDDYRFYDFFDADNAADNFFIPTSTLASPTEVYLFDIFFGQTKIVSRYKMLDEYFYEGVCILDVNEAKNNIFSVEDAVIDTRTGLMWEKCNFFISEDSGFIQDSYFFSNYEAAFERAKKFCLCGFDDWFLPSIDELYTHELIAQNDIKHMYKLYNKFDKKPNLPMQFWARNEQDDNAEIYNHIFNESICDFAHQSKQSSVLVREIKKGEYDWLFA